ncbi:hypothetical protein Dimus_011963 [Dionaea muscipula]
MDVIFHENVPYYSDTPLSGNLLENNCEPKVCPAGDGITTDQPNLVHEGTCAGGINMGPEEGTWHHGEGSTNVESGEGSSNVENGHTTSGNMSDGREVEPASDNAGGGDVRVMNCEIVNYLGRVLMAVNIVLVA